MATIRRHRDKWQVQIRRVGVGAMSKSFTLRRDALEWARHTEREADRHELPSDPKALQRVTLGDLVRRYRDRVSPRKKTAATETGVLNAFLTRQICSNVSRSFVQRTLLLCSCGEPACFRLHKSQSISRGATKFGINLVAVGLTQSVLERRTDIP